MKKSTLLLRYTTRITAEKKKVNFGRIWVKVKEPRHSEKKSPKRATSIVACVIRTIVAIPESHYFFMKMVLVSHVGRAFGFICWSINKGINCCERLASVGRRNSMRVDEGRKTGLLHSRDRKEGACRSGEGGEEPSQ